MQSSYRILLLPFLQTYFSSNFFPLSVLLQRKTALQTFNGFYQLEQMNP